MWTCQPASARKKSIACKAVQSASPLRHLCIHILINAHIHVHMHMFIYTTGCISPDIAGCISPPPPDVSAHNRLHQPRHACIARCTWTCTLTVTYTYTCIHSKLHNTTRHLHVHTHAHAHPHAHAHAIMTSFIHPHVHDNIMARSHDISAHYGAQSAQYDAPPARHTA